MFSVTHHLPWIGALTMSLVMFALGHALGRAWGPR